MQVLLLARQELSCEVQAAACCMDFEMVQFAIRVDLRQGFQLLEVSCQ